MEIDEVAARVVRTYWALLLVLTLVPLLAVFALMSGRAQPAAAQARIVVPGGAAAGAAGDNGVSAAVSTAKAFATGHDLLAKVVKDGRLARDPDKVAKQITAKGLGTSTVVELTVKDRDAAAALKLAQAVATETVDEINTSNQGAVQNQLNQVNQQITALEKQQADASPGTATDRILAQLTDLKASRTELRAQLSAAGNASVAQPAILAPKSDPTVMMAVVAGLGGLVLGILAAVVIEMVRPTVPGQRRVARRLDVPLLGWLGRSQAEAALGRTVRLAARRAGVGQVTVVSAAGGPLPAELVSQVAEAVYGNRTRVVPSQVPEPEKSSMNGKGHVSGKDGDDAATTPPPGEPPSTSVVRASGRSVLTREADEAASPTEVTQPVELRALTLVHAFEDVDPAPDERFGVVAVAGSVTPAAGLESVRDLVAASGWPLLGVVATSRKIKR
ncbi:hypothetical protein [Actinomadura rupiterrae]|uniref:hypothetical protein n=1 Tax=Actinomadura rupiterrae TaxID=559627 RepID=UPI0020A421EC|nr:hypothetical protein [Actinomadura rupiterrae]MCP2335058.1 capsular polysaccharide biosynthesis protein [Actinomadura rupiterrae]